MIQTFYALIKSLIISTIPNHRPHVQKTLNFRRLFYHEIRLLFKTKQDHTLITFNEKNI